jgi:hypothetical protein
MPLNDSDFDGDEEIEATFQRLRQTGHSREEAVQVILNTLDVSLSKAKRLLLTHDTWAEARAATGKADNAGTTNPTTDNDPVPPAPG